MNTKLLGALRFVSLLVYSASAALAGERQHLCPDMHEHEQVLNQGLKVYDTVKPARGFIPRDFGFPSEKASSRWGYWRYDALPSKIEPTKANLVHMRRIQAKWLPLDNYSQCSEALRFAEESEELGMYDPAVFLYKRLLEQQKANRRLERLETRIKDGLERAMDCQSAEELLSKEQFSEAVIRLDSVVNRLSSSDIDLIAKVNILKPVLADIDEAITRDKLRTNKAAANASSSPQNSLSHPVENNQRPSEKVQANAQQLWTEWNRQLECLGMAQKLDRTAFNLEKRGQFEMAEKLYRQALSIKVKNLGLDNIETIKQNADLARTSAAQGRKTQACKYYEDALAKLKKTPQAEAAYASMLESYGDMLEQMKDKSKANKIYEEARAANQKLASSQSAQKQ